MSVLVLLQILEVEKKDTYEGNVTFLEKRGHVHFNHHSSDPV